MSIDRPAHRLDWRGTVTTDDEQLLKLAGLAVLFPVGARVVHVFGRQGTVALDQPAHVPGLFDGDPTAVCLSPIGTPMVYAHWDNTSEIRWGVWVRADLVRRATATAVNRPGNKARSGGRR